MTVRIVAVLFALLALRPAPAEACMCTGKRAACEVMFFQTVFVGKVTSVVPGRGTVKTTFRVLDTLHSAFPLPKTITIEHDTDGSTCGISFAKNATYVVYAGGDSPTDLMVGGCGNSHRLRKNDPDVALAKQKPTRTTVSVEGTMLLYDHGENTPLAGLAVSAGGKRTTTGADGGFTLELPLGNHRVDLDTAELRAFRGQTYTISVPSLAMCSKPTFQYLYDGRIEGTVTGADGKPVEGIEVGAIGSGPDAGKNGGTAPTDAQGHYILHELPEGTYQVGVSLPAYGGPSASSPYPTTIVKKPFALKRAGLVSRVDLTLPAALKRVTFTGTVRHADGSPVKKALVVIDSDKHTAAAVVDDSGAYTATELAGTNITLKACDGDTCVEIKRTKIAADETLDITVK